MKKPGRSPSSRPRSAVRAGPSSPPVAPGPVSGADTQSVSSAGIISALGASTKETVAAKEMAPAGYSTVWQEYRRCGKPSCTRCPHGPYWYGRRDGKTEYIGRNDPRECAHHDVDFAAGCSDVGMACIYLGVGLWQSHRAVDVIYRARVAAASGGGKRERDVRERLSRAYDVVCAFQQWTPHVVREEAT